MARPLRILLLVCLGLVLLEGALQLAAVAVRLSRRDVDAAWLSDRGRVLCVGDSNTYGLYVEREQTWPSRLEALWNERPDAPAMEVSNLGFPGMNSSRVLRDFPRLLTTFEPHVVILMLGANDFWTLPVPVDGASETRGPAEALRRLRSWRLLQALLGAAQGLAIEAPENLPELRQSGEGTARYRGQTFELGWETAKGFQPGRREALAANLRRIVELAHESGATVVLATYAAGRRPYAIANAELRLAAEATGAPLVDTEHLFAEVCPDASCPELFYPDHHPTARGYELLAQALVARLEAETAIRRKLGT